MIAPFPKHPTKTPLRKKLNKVLKKYLKKFCKKHELEWEDIDAIRNDLMGIINVGDYYFDINNIIYDIDNDLPEEVIWKWYNDIVSEKNQSNLHLYYKEWEQKK